MFEGLGDSKKASTLADPGNFIFLLKGSISNAAGSHAQMRFEIFDEMHLVKIAISEVVSGLNLTEYAVFIQGLEPDEPGKLLGGNSGVLFEVALQLPYASVVAAGKLLYGKVALSLKEGAKALPRELGPCRLRIRWRRQ